MNFSFLSSEEMSLLEELWSYLEEKYLTPQYGNYENITINSDSLVSPAMVFISVFLATMTAGVIMIFNKRILGRLVRRLMSRGAVGYENAKTIDELELSSSIPIRLFINRYTLMRAVRCREEDDYYGIDPKDQNIRIAPSYPPVDELMTATKLLCICVKLAAIEKLLSEME